MLMRGGPQPKPEPPADHVRPERPQPVASSGAREALSVVALVALVFSVIVGAAYGVSYMDERALMRRIDAGPVWRIDLRCPACGVQDARPTHRVDPVPHMHVQCRLCSATWRARLPPQVER